MGSLTVPVIRRRAVTFPPPGGTYKSFRPRKEKGTPGSPGLAVCVEPVSLLPRPPKACLGGLPVRHACRDRMAWVARLPQHRCRAGCPSYHAQ
ncbi:hypothetical protein MA16_Dca004814 [Dendrobium catenatum]|uniref:Uncharacterized protein n=1 Tax=Dendrobium catenatum TaxID=906689 RepID=A0A2I0WG23_9ASPA|nr:hypothetical protein MA16_Dca004814 [Dendrobium catenatum]